jgi:hypothetical protein
MKKTLLLLPVLCLMAFTFVPAEEFVLPQSDEKYKVIKVNGQIIVKKSGKSLTQGDELFSSTPLDFKTSDSHAAVISPSKGRYVIKAPGTDGKTNMIPGMNHVSSRGGALLNLIDLQNHFAGDYVILDKTKLKISKEAFPMVDKVSFFFVEYMYKGEKISKRLDFNGDTLMLDRKSIFVIDQKPIEVPANVEMELKYYQVAKNEEPAKSYKINSFKGIFPNLDDLKKELSIIITTLENKKASEQIDEMQAYIQEFYGKTDKDNLKEWVLKNFAMK